MRWNTSSLILLLGLPMIGVCATALYIVCKKDDDDDLDDPHHGITSRACVLEIRIPKESVGVVIGRGGSSIKEVEKRSDTKINFKDDDTDDKTCVIRGSKEGVTLAEAIIHELIMNQPLMETFEMWAPNRATGRIIGRGGESIREISRASNAKVNVDRYQVSDGRSRIVIKGTSEQIAVAKSLIEEKIEEDFDARRKLELTVANRSPRIKSNKALTDRAANNNDEKAERLTSEKLVSVSSDGSLEVYVSAVSDPSKFWVQVISQKTVELDHLVDEMTDYYQIEANQELHKLQEVRKGQIVAAVFEFDKKWYRALVWDVTVDEYDASESKLNLYFVDYGDSGHKKLSEVCQLRTDFLKLCFQAVECSLARVKPSGDSWLEEAIDQFEELSFVALWKPLKARVVNYKDNTREGSPIPCVDLFDTSGPKDIDIGAELVSRGVAISDEKPETSTKDVKIGNSSLEDENDIGKNIRTNNSKSNNHFSDTSCDGKRLRTT